MSLIYTLAGPNKDSDSPHGSRVRRSPLLPPHRNREQTSSSCNRRRKEESAKSQGGTDSSGEIVEFETSCAFSTRSRRQQWCPVRDSNPHVLADNGF